MIPGWTAGQVMPHRWRGNMSGTGRGGLQSNLRFGLAGISARLAGTGRALFLQPKIPFLQASASFVGSGRLQDITGISGAYTASGVHFDGATYLRRHAWLTGVGAFDKFIFSVWTKLSNPGDGLFAAIAGGSDFFQQGMTTVSAGKYFNMNIANSYFDTYPNTPTMQSATWQHVLWSVDISAVDGTSGSIVRRLYVNEVDLSSTVDDGIGTDQSVSGLTDFYFGDDGFAARITGDIADFQLWIGSYLDFSIQANRQLFINNGVPVNPLIASQTLGSPTILFQGNATNFIINQGTGGPFTLHGSLTDSTTSPGGLTASASFAGAGHVIANATIEQPGLLQGAATLIGAGNIVSSMRMRQTALSTFGGAGRLEILPWTPVQLATVVGWWDANDSATLTDAGSGHCSQWNDKSSNANHVTQGTDAKRPIITAASINSKTALVFTRASAMVLANNACTGLSNITTGLSMACIGGFTDNSNNSSIFDVSDSTSTNKGMQLILIAPDEIDLRNNAVTGATEINTVNPAAIKLFAGYIKTTGSSMWINGSLTDTQGGAQTNFTNDHLRMGLLFGDVFPLGGKIAEIVFTSGQISTNDRQLLEGYLAWKWGTQALLPGGHPYASAPP